MKRLNNRGITTIEILICFILLAVISTSLYNTVSTYRNKQILEREKEKIYTYTNLLTKEIQDDIIKKGLTGVSEDDHYTLTLEFNDSTSTKLAVDVPGNKISYDDVDYPLPDFGKNNSESLLKIKDYDILRGIIYFNVSSFSLNINIQFEHPDFGDKYGIHIVAPIGYTS